MGNTAAEVTFDLAHYTSEMQSLEQELQKILEELKNKELEILQSQSYAAKEFTHGDPEASEQHLQKKRHLQEKHYLQIERDAIEARRTSVIQHRELIASTAGAIQRAEMEEKLYNERYCAAMAMKEAHQRTQYYAKAGRKFQSTEGATDPAPE